MCGCTVKAPDSDVGPMSKGQWLIRAHSHLFSRSARYFWLSDHSATQAAQSRYSSNRSPVSTVDAEDGLRCALSELMSAQTGRTQSKKGTNSLQGFPYRRVIAGYLAPQGDRLRCRRGLQRVTRGRAHLARLEMNEHCLRRVAQAHPALPRRRWYHTTCALVARHRRTGCVAPHLRQCSRTMNVAVDRKACERSEPRRTRTPRGHQRLELVYLSARGEPSGHCSVEGVATQSLWSR